MTRTRLLVALLAAAALPYLVGLGDSSIWDANEAFYVETPREMIEAGDFINPSFNYLPRFNKPVLSYWVVAAFYHLFGVSVAVERIPIALSAFVLMAAAFGIGRALKSSEAGLWSAIALATSPRVLMFARRIFIDMWVTMFLGLTLLAFVLAERYPERRDRYLLLMYVAAGLGTLTKGPVAIVLPALVFGVYLAVQRRLGDLRRMRLLTGAIVVLAIVAPWYGALYVQHGWEHIVGFFWGENVARYADAVAPSRGVLFYPPVVFGDMFPWSLLLVAAAVRCLAPIVRNRGQLAPGTDLRLLLWAWILVIVGFFTLSATKQDLYIFPIVVAVAALAGDLLGDGDRGTRLTRWMLALAGVLLIVAAAFVRRMFGGGGHVYQVDGVLPIVVAAGIAGAAAATLAVRRRLFAAAFTIAGCLALLNWIFVLWTLPSFERYKPVPPLSEAIRARAAEDAAVVHYNVALPSMVFYLRRHVDQVFDDPEALINKLGDAREFYLVLRTTEYEALRGEMPVPVCVVDRRPFFDVKLNTLLAREELPEVVLITNRCP
ncbi:MAG TPA: glycosyltransferase family 39 protein [Vicinamibacterales bacterium]|nr:glycosyltransferase family 39 protein [Vicinamibacterales bacterium]